MIITGNPQVNLIHWPAAGNTIYSISYLRNDLKAARNSSAKSCGSSQAAK